jgi:hypothetical protein
MLEEQAIMLIEVHVDTKKLKMSKILEPQHFLHMYTWNKMIF